jgi:hypothetical protein
VPAERRRAAALDGAHHLELGEAHVAAVGRTPGGTMVAEDIRTTQRPSAAKKAARASSYNSSLSPSSAREQLRHFRL